MKFGVDMLDKTIFHAIYKGLNKLIPLEFTGELAVINGPMKNIFLMLILGELLVAIVKRKEAKKKTKTFGMKRDDY